jgi:hypothetical protein
MNIKHSLAASMLALLAACGGGGSSDAGPGGRHQPTASNAAPVANAGQIQNVSTGTTVTLDASASVDPDGDALAYAWSLTLRPAGSQATLSSVNAVRPTFVADTAGTYVASLVVNDGQGNSQPATVVVTVSNSVGPVPPGTGLVVEDGYGMYVIDEATMTPTLDFSCSTDQFMAIDRTSGNVLLAVDQTRLWEVNPVSRACEIRGTTPEWLIAMAIDRSSDQIHGLSYDAHGARQWLYRLSSTGASQGSVPLSGDVRYVFGMAFAPDGQLYGVGALDPDTWVFVRIDTSTGETTTVSPISNSNSTSISTYFIGDIDIDANNVVRGVINGQLARFDLATGALLSQAPIEGFTALSPVAPTVYVP